MKLVNSEFYNRTDEIMGGRITRGEIFVTLSVIQDILRDAGILTEKPLRECFLGSTGKKEISGDIDIGVIPFNSEAAFKLRSHPDVLKVSRAGAVTSIVIAIQGCPEVYLPGNFNGLVQVDLIPGDLKWLKQFFFADERSGFKGAHRNLLISSYLRSFRKQTMRSDWSVFETETGPVFSQVLGIADRELKRQSDKNGKPYATKFNQTVSNQSFDIEKSAEYWFGNYYRDAFTSVETLYRAIEENYNSDFSEAVYKRFFDDYLPAHLNTDDYPWHLVPNMQKERV